MGKTKFFTEFKEFISKGNVFDMAVGVVIGGAFGKIATSLVSDIITPLIALIIGKGAFNSLVFVLKDAVLDEQGIVVTEAITLNIGTFLNTILDFLIIAFCIFLVIKSMMKARNMAESITKKLSKEEAPAGEPAAEPAEAQSVAEANTADTLVEIKKLLEEIRDKP